MDDDGDRKRMKFSLMTPSTSNFDHAAPVHADIIFRPLRSPRRPMPKSMPVPCVEGLQLQSPPPLPPPNDDPSAYEHSGVDDHSPLVSLWDEHSDDDDDDDEPPPLLSPWEAGSDAGEHSPARTWYDQSDPDEPRPVPGVWFHNYFDHRSGMSSYGSRILFDMHTSLNFHNLHSDLHHAMEVICAERDQIRRTNIHALHEFNAHAVQSLMSDWGADTFHWVVVDMIRKHVRSTAMAKAYPARPNLGSSHNGKGSSSATGRKGNGKGANGNIVPGHGSGDASMRGA